MTRSHLLSLAAVCVGLSACATHTPGPERVVYHDVVKTVPVTCVPSRVGPTPSGLETPASLAAISDGPTRYARMAADWFARVARMDETEPTVEGCRTAPSPRPPAPS